MFIQQTVEKRTLSYYHKSTKPGCTKSNMEPAGLPQRLMYQRLLVALIENLLELRPPPTVNKYKILYKREECPVSMFSAQVSRGQLTNAICGVHVEPLQKLFHEIFKRFPKFLASNWLKHLYRFEQCYNFKPGIVWRNYILFKSAKKNCNVLYSF